MTGGLVRPTEGTRIQLAAGKFTVTDDPFVETKEADRRLLPDSRDSMGEALGQARAFMAIAGEGEGEVLRVFDSAEMPSK